MKVYFEVHSETYIIKYFNDIDTNLQYTIEGVFTYWTILEAPG